MNQSIAIMILGSPFASTSVQTALNFSKSVLAMGHRIERIFFYHESVYTGTTLSVHSQDEVNTPEAWQTFIKDNQLDATICIASGIKRGMINAQEAERHEKPANNLSNSMDIGGIGQWIEAVNNADQHIVFGT